MESLLNQVKVLLANEAYVRPFLMLALVLTAGSLVVAFIGRFAFGKKSVLVQSASSGIGILFIYAAAVVLYSCGISFKVLTFPLPFVSFGEDTLYIPALMTGGYVVLCGHLLNLVILSFLVNIINRWLPQGKHLITWLLFRILSVVIGMLLFSLANYLLTSFLPEGFILWAPVILLCLLVIMLLVGALKGLVGAVFATVNPLIGFLYTFFFANIVGKMLTRAMLTTALLTGVVYAINRLGIVAVLISTAALVGYIPLLILLLALWYVIGKLM